jgi:hypothetical protein
LAVDLQLDSFEVCVRVGDVVEFAANAIFCSGGDEGGIDDLEDLEPSADGMSVGWLRRCTSAMRTR